MAGRIINRHNLQRIAFNGSTYLHGTTAAALRPVAISQPQPFQPRHSSHSPLGTPPAISRKKVTIDTLRSLHKKNEPITMITAHDFPSAHVADHAGMEMILVGDSLAMVALGMEDTSEVLLEEMILHCRSVSRATKSAFTVCQRKSPKLISNRTTDDVVYRLVTCQWAHTKSHPSKVWSPLSG